MSELITNKGLAFVATLTQLKRLTLTDCYEVTDEGLKYLYSLEQLEELDLSGCAQLTDAGIEYLSHYTKLQKIDLSRCDQLTDAGLAFLSNLTHLNILSLYDCDKITRGGLARLYSRTQIKEIYTKINLPRKPRKIVITDHIYHPEGLKHRTDRGEKVRSKSEVIIANTLHNLGINYIYERKLTTEDGSILLPDFTILNDESQPFIWEHLGMLHQDTYAKHWEEKLACYQANGFKLGENLFITRDDSGGGLDSLKINQLARFIKTLIVQG